MPKLRLAGVTVSSMGDQTGEFDYANRHRDLGEAALHKNH